MLLFVWDWREVAGIGMNKFGPCRQDREGSGQALECPNQIAVDGAECYGLGTQRGIAQRKPEPDE